MFKRELKYNFKNFLIWLIVTMFIFLIVYLVYPSITNGDNIKAMDEMMEAFPKELLEAFNMDISSVSTAYGWIKTEGFIFILLIFGSYSGLLGSNILLKEESDKTIEYLNSLPISRSKIIISKILVGLIYVISFVLLVGLFNFICLDLSGNFDKKQFILLIISSSFSSVVIYSLCMFISTFFNKTKKVLGISLIIVFVSYLFNAFSSISDSVEKLKYLSVYTLVDVRNIILDVKINPIMLIITLSLTFMFLVFSLIRFNKKNLV